MTAPAPAPAALAAFIRRETRIGAPPLCPEIRLHLASAITPIWEASEATLAESGIAPPYWAFAWAGGQALARYLLDHPEEAAGRRVLDFGAGSGLAGIAAARAGAARVVAAEIDPCAAVATGLNAALNGVAVEVRTDDAVGEALRGFDLVLAGDVCYERPMAERVVPWLRRLAAAGARVLLADPGRAYLPRRGLEERARYLVPTSREIEDREARATGVFELLAAGEAIQDSPASAA
ncbi:MAG: methyltransferase [Proteobacteria bacterium]|nr:methyltransferase [Pseudomonadota bacterium]